VSSQPQEKPPASNEPKGYQPSPGRKLFMLALCIVGLIVIWTYYWFQSQKP
jgi:hypothetical protein